MQMLTPSLLSSSNISLFFLSTILFWPIISDLSSLRPPPFLTLRMHSTARSVSSFRDRFSITVADRYGTDLTTNQSLSLLRTNFRIAAGLSFRHSIIANTFSLPSSPLVKSKVSEQPPKIPSTLSSYLAGTAFDFSTAWTDDLCVPNIRALFDFSPLFFLWGLQKFLSLQMLSIRLSLLLALQNTLLETIFLTLTSYLSLSSTRGSLRKDRFVTGSSISSSRIYSCKIVVMRLAFISRKLLLQSQNLQYSFKCFLISYSSECRARLSNNCSLSLMIQVCKDLNSQRFFSLASTKLSDFSPIFSLCSSLSSSRISSFYCRLLYQSWYFYFIPFFSLALAWILTLYSYSFLSSLLRVFFSI